MAVQRNRFTDPATGNFYDWALNHHDEQSSGKKRNVEVTANTGGIGRVRQQTTDDPLIFRYEGTILTVAHLQSMWDWFKLCGSQTIHFTDFAGDRYEVQITDFNPIRKRAVKNPKGGTVNPLYYWEYTLEMQVYGIISGTLAGHVSP